jgi:hypothetical protein
MGPQMCFVLCDNHATVGYGQFVASLAVQSLFLDSECFLRWYITLRAIWFVVFVHRQEFEIIIKHDVSKTGSASVFRSGEGDTYSVGSHKKS